MITHPGSIGVSGARVVISVVFLFVGVAIYVLPAAIAVKRKTVNLGAVIAIDLLLGWTVAGWIVAFAMALSASCQQRPRRQQLPPAM